MLKAVCYKFDTVDFWYRKNVVLVPSFEFQAQMVPIPVRIERTGKTSIVQPVKRVEDLMNIMMPGNLICNVDGYCAFVKFGNCWVPYSRHGDELTKKMQVDYEEFIASDYCRIRGVEPVLLAG